MSSYVPTQSKFAELCLLWSSFLATSPHPCHITNTSLLDGNKSKSDQISTALFQLAANGSVGTHVPEVGKSCDMQVSETPASKQQRPMLQTDASMEEPETPSGHEKPVSSPDHLLDSTPTPLVHRTPAGTLSRTFTHSSARDSYYPCLIPVTGMSFSRAVKQLCKPCDIEWEKQPTRHSLVCNSFDRWNCQIVKIMRSNAMCGAGHTAGSQRGSGAAAGVDARPEASSQRRWRGGRSRGGRRACGRAQARDGRPAQRVWDLRDRRLHRAVPGPLRRVLGCILDRTGVFKVL